jgi:hypothetical protein
MTSLAGRYRPRSRRRRRPPPAACPGTRECRPSPPAWGGPGTLGCQSPHQTGAVHRPLAARPTSRGSHCEARRTPREGWGDCSSCATGPASLQRRGRPQISVVGLGRVTARQDPGPEVLAPQVLMRPGVAMVDPASTWWFSADRRWHKGQPPQGWYQGPDRRWHPPTDAPAPSREHPAAPRTAVEPAEPAASDGPSDTGPSHAQGARHLQGSPRRFWNRRHSK